MAFDLSTAKPVGFDLSTAKPVLPPESGEPGIGEKLLRQTGLTARAGIQGLASIPGLGADAVNSIVNLGIDAYNKATGSNIRPQMTTGQMIDKGLSSAGLPTPQNPTERIVGDATSAMTGAGSQAKTANYISEGASGLKRAIAEKFAEGPGAQIVGTATGIGAGSAAREGGVGPGGQIAATLIGGALPAAAQTTGSLALRGALRGGEEGRLKTAGNIDTFSAAGTTPTVGQATESRASRLAETMLAKTPGSAGLMNAKALQQAKDIGGKVGDLADSLTLRSGAAPAGRAIQQGIEGTGGFVDQFKAKQQQLYDKLDQYIPNDQRVDISNTRDLLSKINADIPGAPNTSKFFKNSKIQGIEGALKSDTETPSGVVSQMPPIQRAIFDQLTPIEQTATSVGLMDGKLPFEALKKMRTLVGNEITNNTLTSDVPKSKWKALYGALSSDIESTAKATGPDAEKAFNQANVYTKAGHARLENVLQSVVGKADPEDIFRAATSGMQEGATTIQGVMKSLPDASKRSVAATVLNRMGVAQAGKQDATGEVFSPETFLTNWNKMTPDSKTALFSRYGLNFTDNLDKVAATAANLRTGNKIFANPSGTEAALTSKLGVAGVIYGVLFGHPATAAALGGGMAAAHMGTKYLMTNPAFVGWLAQTTTAPKGALATQINLLEQLSAKQPKEQGDAMRSFAGSLRNQSAPAQ